MDEQVNTEHALETYKSLMLGSLVNHDQEPWKMPLPQFIEHCYEKRFQRARPHDTRSIEEKEKDKKE